MENEEKEYGVSNFTDILCEMDASEKDTWKDLLDLAKQQLLNAKNIDDYKEMISILKNSKESCLERYVEIGETMIELGEDLSKSKAVLELLEDLASTKMNTQ